MSYLTYILAQIRRDPRAALRSGLKLVEELWMDGRIGVWTAHKDFVPHPSATGDSHPCQPVPYRVLAGLARHMEARGLTGRPFVDVGCGAGRPLAYLSRLGFPRMTGIDINPEAATRARRNVARIRPSWRRAGTLEILTGDVLRVEVTFPGCVVLLANPFGAQTMRAFAERVKDQLRAHPGEELHLYYTLPRHVKVLEEVFSGAERSLLEGLEPTWYFHLGGAAPAAP